MMKKIFSVLCVLLVVSLLFSSCVNITRDAKYTSTTSANAQDSTSKPIYTMSDKEKVRQKLLTLVNTTESYEDPFSMLGSFDGDFSISGIASNSSGIESIKRKNGVIEVASSYVDYWGFEDEEYLYWVSYYDNQALVDYALPLDSDVGEKSTVFTTFGIDTSSLWGTTSDETEIDLEITADMITVSDDLSSCTLSREYLDEFSKIVCEAVYTEEQTAKFLSEYTGSGVYSVSNNELAIEIEIDDPELGKLRAVEKQSIDDAQKVSVFMYMSYSNESIGITEPIVMEVSVEDCAFRDGNPVSGTFKRKQQAPSFYQDGSYIISVLTTENITCTIDISDAAKPKADVTLNRVIKETYQGNSSTFTTGIEVKIDQSKSSSQFKFTEKQNGYVEKSFIANKINFATPSSFPAVPSKVSDEISLYIN